MGQVVAYRRLKTIEISKTVSRKSVAVACRRWSFRRGFSVSLWLRTFLVFWGGGCLWEVVARGGSTVRSKGQTGLKFSFWSICLFRQQGVSLLYFVFILQVWSSCVYRHLHDSSRRLLFDIFRCLRCIFKSRYWLRCGTRDLSLIHIWRCRRRG